MKKREYVWGLFTGFIVAAFLTAAVLGGIALFKKGDSGEIERQSREAAITTSSDVVVTTSTPTPSAPQTSATGKYLSDDSNVKAKMNYIEEIIHQLYIEDMTEEEIEDGIYRGMMESLGDPYAVYYNAEELKQLQESTEGVYYGVGAYLQLDETYMCPKITGIMDDSPAAESELQVDDIIYKVDDVEIANMDLTKAVSLIKGPENTPVKLTVYRLSTGETIDVNLVRRKVETPTVKYEALEDDIAYIRIEQFDEITTSQFTDAYAMVKGSNAKGLIIDLRSNPGGSLTTVVDIASQILPKGIIVYTEDKYGTREDYKSDNDTPIDIPLVVLVNGNSASASEILAGAVKDYGIGTIMGTQTFGKGIVQRILSLPDGTALKLTVSHYYTPNGNDIHKIGIEPDVIVEFDADAYKENKDNDNQIKAAVEYLKEEIY